MHGRESLGLQRLRRETKKFRKVERQHFLAHFMPKIDQNIGNFPYFYKMSDISKSRRIRFLKLGMSVRPEIWTSYSLYMPLKSYGGDFENFHFQPDSQTFVTFLSNFVTKVCETG